MTAEMWYEEVCYLRKVLGWPPVGRDGLTDLGRRTQGDSHQDCIQLQGGEGFENYRRLGEQG